jgi:hypothetical protein
MTANMITLNPRTREHLRGRGRADLGQQHEAGEVLRARQAVDGTSRPCDPHRVTAQGALEEAPPLRTLGVAVASAARVPLQPAT